MEKHGVFISYRREDWLLAGRIYDFLKAKGLYPFLDTMAMRQKEEFPKQLEQVIRQAPYFLCVLTKNTFRRGMLQKPDSRDWVYKELEMALSDPNKGILLIAEAGFQWPKNLPQELKEHRLQDRHFVTVDNETFLSKMEELCRKDIDREKLLGFWDWGQRLAASNNVCLCSRDTSERKLAQLSDRFGAELITALSENREYNGENHVRSIRMSCYAASIIFTPQQNMVDVRAFDKHRMSKLFSWLMKDPDFSLEIMINAPGSTAMQDAIDHKKLGNSSQETSPEEIFYGSFGNIMELLNKSDSYLEQARVEGRFRFLVTESMLPYALFQVEYKPGYEEYNHIKVDLYSEGLVSNMDRLCMIIFEKNDPKNYEFFAGRYNSTRDAKRSETLIREHGKQWIDQWEEMKERKARGNGTYGNHSQSDAGAGVGEKV